MSLLFFVNLGFNHYSHGFFVQTINQVRRWLSKKSCYISWIRSVDSMKGRSENLFIRKCLPPNLPRVRVVFSINKLVETSQKNRWSPPKKGSSWKNVSHVPRTNSLKDHRNLQVRLTLDSSINPCLFIGWFFFVPSDLLKWSHMIQGQKAVKLVFRWILFKITSN